MFFYLLEILVIVLVVHQVALPMIKGLPVFPFFREKKFEDKLGELNQKVKEKQLGSKIEEVKRELKGKK